ncbi:hypothetical protein [Clostridium sp. Marseille-P2415]|uniref:hypothetical protein n=1 Tax=Clostridium sp. Marseille-P2415 TaxID=1805471 RepID=UPI0009884E5A|nr:hypothetical protein [Clostridium sp. Marseille-P2415]
MLNLELKKEQEINNMVTVLKQLDLTGIRLLTRDANTLLALKLEVAKENELYQEDGREGWKRRNRVSLWFG